ncbi:MAG: TIGR02450 family Trp-rich protein [Oceanospirillales bacterium TMED33]|nr:TIGR02450 family Trp-rich protein [Gammaproteobacteria bacterium]OUX65080.1 MAG: hypothetical protein CBE41_02045 [Gammaproteobacteria bacterium TMED281]RPG20676.1 MAG: TIGR02450 family Trp-rich protein [Oceanospirillales bacterium TMED33]CAI8417340.1 MAG: Uncharacterised protein [Gammaproteobacteria bacterium]
MNRINPKKLLHSKWTAVTPTIKEKHFLVVDIEFDEDGLVVCCVLEAVVTKRKHPINWCDLKDSYKWKMGWNY